MKGFKLNYVNVKNKTTGEVGVATDVNAYGGITVYAPPKRDYEVVGKLIARYKTRKGFWQRWEIKDE